MASGTTNWVHDKGNVTEKDISALEQAKKIEYGLKRKGWCLVKINERLQILVPCDKKKKPTEEGQKRIDMLKASLGIK